jgi:hypothetical protein
MRRYKLTLPSQATINALVPSISTFAASLRRPDTGGIFSSKVARWRANCQTRALKALANRSYAEAKYFDALVGLGGMIVAAFVLLFLARPARSAVQKGAEVADNLLAVHPARRFIYTAHRARTRLKTNALQDAVTPSASILSFDIPLYHYKDQTKKTRALKEKLDEDISYAQADIRRARARVDLECPERD